MAESEPVHRITHAAFITVPQGQICVLVGTKAHTGEAVGRMAFVATDNCKSVEEDCRFTWQWGAKIEISIATVIVAFYGDRID